MIATLEFTIGLKMFWSDLTLPPINLYSFPIQQDFIRRQVRIAATYVSPRNSKYSNTNAVDKLYKSRSNN